MKRVLRGIWEIEDKTGRGFLIAFEQADMVQSEIAYTLLKLAFNRAGLSLDKYEPTTVGTYDEWGWDGRPPDLAHFYNVSGSRRSAAQEEQ